MVGPQALRVEQPNQGTNDPDGNNIRIATTADFGAKVLVELGSGGDT
jgi:hypothetical protein